MKKVIFDRKNILVTGGAGFIGSHLCDELVKTAKVICLDSFITSAEANIDHLLDNPNFAFVRHDIAKPIDLESLPGLQKFKVQFQGIQEIYHLACPTSPLHFEKNRQATLLANSYGMKNALDLAAQYQAKFLHFSSSVVYGARQIKDGKSARITEEALGKVDMLSPRACYDEGKRFAESFVATYRDMFEVDAKIMRVFRTYGPRMPLGDGQMIPDFINNALDNKDLTILGNEDFTTSLCYVKDVVDAALKMMETDVKTPINIGSDVNISLTKIAQKIIDLTNSKSRIQYAKAMLFMTPLCLPNLNKAANELGWLPIVTLENGLKRTIEDLMANKGLLRVA